MATVVGERDLSVEAPDGWMVEYEIRRDDGREVVVVAECASAAAAEIDDAGNGVRSFVADRGRSSALTHAEAMNEYQHRLRLACYDARFGVTVETDTPRAGG